jgi:hypothetical protein
MAATIVEVSNRQLASAGYRRSAELIKTSRRRRHEVRDEGGNLIAVIDIVGDDRSSSTPSMIELAG